MYTPRTLSITAGLSYLVIFFAAIFANFFVLEPMFHNPVDMLSNNNMLVRLGIIAFMVTVLFDIIVAWALYELFKKNSLSLPALLFRMTHAILMGAAIAALPMVFTGIGEDQVVFQLMSFNTLWLIGLFFFGLHLIFMGKILWKELQGKPKTFGVGVPRTIGVFLILAGIMYMVDTTAQFAYPNYESYADIFLAMVAVPSILGEFAFGIWLLMYGGKN